jgi:enediyne biosynthesis thioesterase
VSCEYLSELKAFDEVIVRMRLGELTQSRITLLFEFWRSGPPEELTARGEQQIACLRREGEDFAPAPVPKSLREALRQYESH